MLSSDADGRTIRLPRTVRSSARVITITSLKIRSSSLKIRSSAQRTQRTRPRTGRDRSNALRKCLRRPLDRRLGSDYRSAVPRCFGCKTSCVCPRQETRALSLSFQGLLCADHASKPHVRDVRMRDRLPAGDHYLRSLGGVSLRVLHEDKSEIRQSNGSTSEPSSHSVRSTISTFSN